MPDLPTIAAAIRAKLQTVNLTPSSSVVAHFFTTDGTSKHATHPNILPVPEANKLTGESLQDYVMHAIEQHYRTLTKGAVRVVDVDVDIDVH